jgi:hypothetical protein
MVGIPDGQYFDALPWNVDGGMGLLRFTDFMGTDLQTNKSYPNQIK